MTQKEILDRLLEIYKQGKQTGHFESSIFNLMSDIAFDIGEFEMIMKELEEE
jgi:hypothetical protein